jgi:hypothetical protein
MHTKDKGQSKRARKVEEKIKHEARRILEKCRLLVMELNYEDSGSDYWKYTSCHLLLVSEDQPGFTLSPDV